MLQQHARRHGRTGSAREKEVTLIPSHSVSRAEGKLAVLLPGMGAVATTMIAGVLLARRGMGLPVGSLTQLGSVRLGRGLEERVIPIGDLVPLAKLDQLEFGGWDIFEDDAYEAALHAGVLKRDHLDLVKDELSAIKPMRGVFYREFVKRLDGQHTKTAHSKAEMVEAVRADIRGFLREHGCNRAVSVWCGSTEIYTTPSEVHGSIGSFEAGLERNDGNITNAQIYAWALLKEGVPFANGSPNVAVDFPAAQELAREHGVALAGKDFKTGQTLMKTIVAPGLKSRLLGMRGWYSTNILGNRDGEVLDDPDNFRAKEVSKLGVLESILDAERHPALYGDFVHKVRIDYYPPRGDDKEGWDNIDLFGWLGYPMQMKINFLCKDSILAAPIVLDLALLLDLASRCKLRGTQDWLGFYFKSPMAIAGVETEHDLFNQLMTLKNSLRRMGGEMPLTHAGHERYD
jgi:myo-inositol-1-phosphate synthase